MHELLCKITILYKLFLSTGRGFSAVVAPPTPPFGNPKLSVDHFNLPAVLLWNPKITHPTFVQHVLSKCQSCGSTMHEGYWNDGSSYSTQPRSLHDVGNVVLLVSAVYICENHHKTLAHDERVLQCFPSQTLIPFVLLHRSGFTRELVDICTALVRSGVNFYNMETLILQRRWETYARQQDTLRIQSHLMKQSGHDPVKDDFLVTELARSPSNDLLAKCFLAGFMKEEDLYLKEILSTDTTNTLSFDHTFKVASNIGFLREDNVWVTQYDSLFIVMNNKGQVVTWQLTKGTSFGQIEHLLSELSHRALQQSQNIKTIYIDECCKLRNKVQSVFGTDVSVKLDIFHAVQRVTKTLPKRHQLTKQCVAMFRQVFRKDGDSGEKRMSHTPSPQIILSKLESFAAKWKDAKDLEGKKLFTSATLSAISNLKKHISAGCLSNIPPGGGTNRNERFHRHLKNFFHQSRVGIYLAYALLTVIIHSHNSAWTTRGKCVVRPISASLLRWTSLSKVPPIGIMPKVQLQQQSVDGSQHWEIDVNDCQMDIEQVSSIYTTALQKLHIARSLQKMKLTNLKDDIANFKQFELPVECAAPQPENQLFSRLSQYGLTFTPVSPDGNCFFKSIALNLMAEHTRWTDTLNRIGVSQSVLCDLEGLSMKLRQLFVQEIVGERRELYESYVVQGEFDYLAEANKFLQDGFYDSCLGDTMPLAMATVLQLSIVIITSNTDSQIMYITPEVITADSSIFLIYHPSGAGHYDAALPYFDPVQESTAPVPAENVAHSVRCTCGKNNSDQQRMSCVPLSHYSTRCKCYNTSKSCTLLCQCKHCSNPHGMKPVKENRKRTRNKHYMQVEIPDSKKFAIDRGESMSNAIWSDFEAIVLSEVCAHGEDTESTKLYNDIVYFAKSRFCTNHLPQNVVFREKTREQIQYKLQFMNK